MADRGADTQAATSIVATWLDALGRRDVDAVLAASAPDVELVGPRGTSTGHEPLQAWVSGVGFAATSLRWYANPTAVVVEQLATWVPRDPELEPPRPAVRIATAFTVRGGLVGRIERFDTVDDALRETGLAASDAVPDPQG